MPEHMVYYPEEGLALATYLATLAQAEAAAEYEKERQEDNAA